MKKIATKDLQQGMITVEAIRTPLGQLLAPAGTELTRQIINKMKLYNCEYAIIDMVEDEPPVPEAEPSPVAEPPVVEPPIPKTHVEASKTPTQRLVESDAFHDFQKDYSLALAHLHMVFSEVANNSYTIEAQDLVRRISPLFLTRNTITELFDMLNQMHSIEDSVYAHCVNVALIARMIGRWLHLEQNDLDTLTCCGLLHDIGKVKIPEAILNKPGKLTDQEYYIVKAHTKFGYEMLRNQNIDPRIKQSVLMHHERFDRSGYPNGLDSTQIIDFAAIIAIADVYDAMTSARAYRVPLCPFEVVSKFEDDGFQKYHPKYIYIFLHKIVTTYEGNRIMLNDGRAGKIVMINQKALSRPIIQLETGECLDLSTQRELFITRIM